MKITLKEILSSGNMSAASLTSKGLLVDQIFCGSIQANWTGGSGTPQGTLKVQGSNDDVPVKPDAPIANYGVNGFVGSDPAGNVVNWADIPSATISVSGNTGSGIVNLATLGYKWLRAIYTKSSGQGTMSIVFFGKG